jgi:phosphomethylpyrimidine synthase
MDNTIIRRAREGRIDDEMRKIAEAEGVSPEKLRDRIAKGQVVYIRNVKWPSEKVVAIGKGLSTKINVNLGTSTEVVDLDSELKKVEVANKWGDTLMDLSVGGDLDAIRRAVISKSKLPVGTVPVYQAFIEAFNKRSGGAYFTIDDLFNTIERQLKDGVAFMTIHAAVTKEAAIRV